MKESVTDRMSAPEIAAAKGGRRDAEHLQSIEGNPLSRDQIALFEMFEREGWSHERRRSYLLERAWKAATQAAE